MIMLKATPAALGAALQRLVGGVPLESAARRALRLLDVDNDVPDATSAEICMGHQEYTVSRFGCSCYSSSNPEVVTCVIRLVRGSSGMHTNLLRIRMNTPLIPKGPTAQP